jgi:radical SAM protein with 4Fe4S-binding SPASM domain
MVALWRSIRRDWNAFRERLSPSPPPQPGMHTYRFTPPGGSVRVHLRVEADRSGVLFVDVTDIVHLNPTACEMAKWALDGVAREIAESRLLARFGPRSVHQWQADLAAVYGMVQRLANPSIGCPTCSLNSVKRTALFSTPVHAPYKADLAITYDCNNDCPHCYNEADRLAMGLMSASEWRQVIDKLNCVGVPHLIFTGGEATLHPNLPEIIHHADQSGPICGLNTNGRRFAHASYANELAAAGLNHVQVTLGSHRPEIHDRMMNAHSFQQTVRGIENALAAGLHTITNTTLMRMNADDIEDTIAFIHRLGIRTFAVNGMIYSGGGFDTGQAIPEQLMPPILVRIRDTARELGMKFLWYTPTQYCRLSPVELEIGAKRCNAGEYSLCVEPNGDVLPCQSYYVAAGNLLRDPWEEIWNGGLFVSFRDRELDPRGHGLPEKCWECPDLSLCGGGCRIEREAQDGVRVKDGATHGCSGCGSGGCGSGGCGTGTSQTAAGFVGIESLLMPSKRRGSGNFADALASDE